MADPRLVDDALVERLHRRAGGDRWGVSLAAFARALERSARRAFAEPPSNPSQLEKHLGTLHLEDLALACACADGVEAAWDHFVREYRPVLYRAAAAIDPGGGARDLADSMYAELYGLTSRDGERRSHLDYFHGRSSLATWLRAVLAQRHIDRLRGGRREAPLPDADSSAALVAPEVAPSSDRLRFAALVQAALAAALARLAPRERLRLACYYADDLTLAEIGRMLGEHEATVSRQLAKARKALRQDVERHLREEGLDDGAIRECFATVSGDPGPLDVADLLGTAAGKNPAPDRSQ